MPNRTSDAPYGTFAHRDWTIEIDGDGGKPELQTPL